MRQGEEPDPDEVARLEAVWGRAASAAAPPAPRPSPPDDQPSGPTRRRPRRALLGGVGVAAGLALAVLGLRALAQRDEPRARGAATATTTTSTGPALLEQPTWELEVACPPRETEEGTVPTCPVATDDERVYVLQRERGVTRLRARAVAAGDVAWEVEVDGGRGVHRLASIVLVISGEGDTVALDPETGEERWRHPGTLTGPVGRDHLVLDHVVEHPDGSATSTMAVLEAGTGEVVRRWSGPARELFVHPCGDDLVLASEGDRLSAHRVPGGTQRWSIAAAHADLFSPVHCGDGIAALVDAGAVLRLVELETGSDVARLPLDVEAGDAVVRGVAGGAVVVQTADDVRGFGADAAVAPLWSLACAGCRRAQSAAGDGGVVVAVDGAAAAWAGAEPGGGLDLPTGGEVVLRDGWLLAWGPGGVVAARTEDLAGAVRLADAGVRAAAASSTHLVVTTGDEVRVYPLSG